MFFRKLFYCFIILILIYVENVKTQGREEDYLNETLLLIHELEANFSFLNSSVYNYLYPSHLSISELQKIEDETWHWFPYKNLKLFLDDLKKLCNQIGDNTGKEFPDSIFTLQELRQGAIILYLIGAVYFFTLLTVVCNDYFIPSVECICEDLNISKDVAAATFMATATSMPEFFTNTISTFLTDSDLGIGTIIGSLMFNTLGVSALAGLAAPKPVQLDWWPITRDCVLYSINLSVLVFFAWDGYIFWFEALVFVLLYFIYFIIMLNNQKIMNTCKWWINERWNLCKMDSYDVKELDDINYIKSTEIPFNQSINIFIVEDKYGYGIKKHHHPNDNFIKTENKVAKHSIQVVEPQKESIIIEENHKSKSLWVIPRHTKSYTLWWFFIWPIRFLLTYTIPNPKIIRRLYPLTFVMCIFWIGGNSYMVVWMVVRIGETFSIPDSVMGLTFLAAGGCLPEAISAVIMARKGEGGMGVSNSLGANSLAIIFSLGLPWFIQTMVDGGLNTSAFVTIHSYGIEFVILSLLFAVACLYGIISLAGYRLKKIVGMLLLIVYLFFVTFAILVELDIFFPSGNAC